VSSTPKVAGSPVDQDHTTAAKLRVTDPGQQLSTLFDVAKILATQDGLGEMLSRVLSCLINTFESADAGLIMLYDSHDKLLHVEAAQGYHFASLSQFTLACGESITGKAFETGRAELYQSPEATASGMATLTPLNRELFTNATSGVEDPLGSVCIPMRAGEERIGVLVLENLRQPTNFQADDMPFLQAVADLVALSAASSQLMHDLRASQSLAEANRLKAEVVSILAHEMRTPLTSIKGYSTALLMEEAAFSAETQREFLEIIDEECDVLADLIHDLLESSIIDAGLLRLEMQPVLLPRLTDRVIADISHRSKAHRLLVDFPEGFPVVYADPNRVAQVLHNLLDNAIKYSPGGGLIVVRGQALDECVMVTVADQGVGIAPEDLNRLFERFFRGQGLGQHVVGSGLGLPICLTIIEAHGGLIWADSQVGQGSTFHFTLPLTRTEDGEDGSVE
jgi:signal transduction histidine kinase